MRAECAHILFIKTETDMARKITLTVTRSDKPAITLTYDNEATARFWAQVSTSRGYHVAWRESWEG